MDEIFKRRPWVTKILTSDSLTSSTECIETKKRSLSPCKTELPPKRKYSSKVRYNVV